MCGISGMFNLKDNRPFDELVLDRMLEKIRHRGPDGKNMMLLDNRAALGFVRLSFIDLTGGMQPIQNEDGSVTMTCNGEIFNFQELREELIQKGHTFRTRTDVETIVHMYEEYGLDFPKYLNGQFAIALYDKNKEQFVLVRDHMGICPLFYTVADDRVIYASLNIPVLKEN